MVQYEISEDERVQKRRGVFTTDESAPTETNRAAEAKGTSKRSTGAAASASLDEGAASAAAGSLISERVSLSDAVPQGSHGRSNKESAVVPSRLMWRAERLARMGYALVCVAIYPEDAAGTTPAPSSGAGDALNPPAAVRSFSTSSAMSGSDASPNHPRYFIVACNILLFRDMAAARKAVKKYVLGRSWLDRGVNFNRNSCQDFRDGIYPVFAALGICGDELAL